MTKSEKKEQEKAPSKDESETQNKEQKEKKITPIKEETPEEKLKTTQDKLLRTMAEMENQRRRFEKKDKKLLSLVDLILLESLCHSWII